MSAPLSCVTVAPESSQATVVLRTASRALRRAGLASMAQALERAGGELPLGADAAAAALASRYVRLNLPEERPFDLTRRPLSAERRLYGSCGGRPIGLCGSILVVEAAERLYLFSTRTGEKVGEQPLGHGGTAMLRRSSMTLASLEAKEGRRVRLVRLPADRPQAPEVFSAADDLFCPCAVNSAHAPFWSPSSALVAPGGARELDMKLAPGKNPRLLPCTSAGWEVLAVAGARLDRAFWLLEGGGELRGPLPVVSGYGRDEVDRVFCSPQSGVLVTTKGARLYHLADPAVGLRRFAERHHLARQGALACGGAWALIHDALGGWEWIDLGEDSHGTTRPVSLPVPSNAGPAWHIMGEAAGRTLVWRPSSYHSDGALAWLVPGQRQPERLFDGKGLASLRLAQIVGHLVLLVHSNGRSFSLSALSAETGAELWRLSLPRPRACSSPQWIGLERGASPALVLAAGGAQGCLYRLELADPTASAMSQFRRCLAGTLSSLW